MAVYGLVLWPVVKLVNITTDPCLARERQAITEVSTIKALGLIKGSVVMLPTTKQESDKYLATTTIYKSHVCDLK